MEPGRNFSSTNVPKFPIRVDIIAFLEKKICDRGRHALGNAQMYWIIADEFRQGRLSADFFGTLYFWVRDFARAPRSTASTF
jgi:hypothetical protein